jgi:replication factor A1
MALIGSERGAGGRPRELRALGRWCLNPRRPAPCPPSSPLRSQVARQLGATLKNNDIVRVTEGNLTTGANDRQVLIVAAMEVVAAGAAGDVAAMAVDAAPIAAAPASPAAPGTETKTPAAAALKTAGGAGAPRSGPTPPSSGPAAAGGLKSASKRPTVPLSSLNPYMHGWAVRAKVLSKGPKRSFSKAGAPSSVFSAELVDAHGTAIEATFWREAADRLHEALDEGRVYVFARGSVKPANKKFSAVRNDYCLHFDAAAEVEEAGERAATPPPHRRLPPNRRQTAAASGDPRTPPPHPRCRYAK